MSLLSNKKTALPLLLGGTLALGIWIGLALHKALISKNSPSGQVVINKNEIGKVEEVLRYIETRYIEEADRHELEEVAIKSILKKLDPHSNYISTEQLTRVNESLDGNFQGVGIEFFILHDTVLIVSVLPGGPSDKAGLLGGDKIISINDTLISDSEMKTEDVIGKLRGQIGTSVKVGISRPGKEELLEFSINRGEIPIKSIDVAYMLDRNTGYIKINRFSNKTYTEFMEGLEHMVEKQKMENLVIDVRQNPGGYLIAAKNIIEQLFEGKELIVYTEGRSWRKREYKSNGKPWFKLKEVTVLIDEGSASASEILAGAIQDQDAGMLIGRRTFGKGLVQEQYDLSDNSALRLTVARYYTPSGRSIQKAYGEGREKYNADFENRILSGELLFEDSIKIVDSTEFKTSKGRTVYGAGGIMPDVFVPMDTIVYNPYYVRAYRMIPEFVYEFLDGKRLEFGQYESFKQFDAGFDVDAGLFNRFLDFLSEKEASLEGDALSVSEQRLKMMIKAYIAKQFYQDEGYYKVIHQQDPFIIEALKKISDKQFRERAMNN